jgi:hypothetical protein
VRKAADYVVWRGFSSDRPDPLRVAIRVVRLEFLIGSRPDYGRPAPEENCSDQRKVIASAAKRSAAIWGRNFYQIATSAALLAMTLLGHVAALLAMTLLAGRSLFFAGPTMNLRPILRFNANGIATVTDLQKNALGERPGFHAAERQATETPRSSRAYVDSHFDM